MASEQEELRIRIERLEAREACISTLNEYLYYLDGERTEELLRLFTPDALLEVMNYPPGTGEDVVCRGREEIRPVFVGHHGIMTRHHASNITVQVQADGRTAELSAYFLTAIQYGLSGGLYEATLTHADGKWLFTRLRICSNWGWIIPQEVPPFLADPLDARTLRGGRPVVYEPPSTGETPE